jgi:hypothetical protein
MLLLNFHMINLLYHRQILPYRILFPYLDYSRIKCLRPQFHARIIHHDPPNSPDDNPAMETGTRDPVTQALSLVDIHSPAEVAHPQQRFHLAEAGEYRLHLPQRPLIIATQVLLLLHTAGNLIQ